MRKIRRVMYATDFSKVSRAAFVKAVEIAKATRAALVMVHVLTFTVPFLVGMYLSPRAVEGIKGACRIRAQKRLNSLVTRAKRAGVSASGLIVEGEPYEQIIRAARSKKVDLLVIGTHGRTGLPRFILGSVAGRVVVTAPCPVLTVHGE
jgi:nucleotide-binding universal stress UspA family protein